MESNVEQFGLGGKPWTERAEIHLIKETLIDEETGNEVLVYKTEIMPGELGILMNISPQKASQILSQFKDSPNYEREKLRGGKCVYKLVG